MILYNVLSFEEHVLCPACVKCSVNKEQSFLAALILFVMKKLSSHQSNIFSALSNLKQEVWLD